MLYLHIRIGRERAAYILFEDTSFRRPRFALRAMDPESQHSWEKTTFAFSIACGVCPSFQTEAYLFHQPQFEGGTVFWVLRWAIDYLGGNRTRNFIGQSAQTWRNKIAAGLEALGQEPELSSRHVLTSTWSELQRQTPSKRKDVSEDTVAPQEASQAGTMLQDYSISTFGLLCLLSWWAAHGPRATTTWNLEASEFCQRCRSIISGLASLFVQQGTKKHSKVVSGFDLLLSSHASGHGLLHVANLLDSEKGSNLKKTFAGKNTVPLDEAFLQLASDSGAKGLGTKRRDAATEAHANLCWFVAELVEASGARKDSVWQRTQLHQLDQLRTQRFVFMMGGCGNRVSTCFLAHAPSTSSFVFQLLCISLLYSLQRLFVN